MSPRLPRKYCAVLLLLAGSAPALGQVGRIDEWPTDQLNQAPTSLRHALYQSVAVGYGFTVAILANGNVVGWRSPNSGELDPGGPWVEFDSSGNPTTASPTDPNPTVVQPPSPLPTFLAISASYTHILGLTTNHELVAWGDNRHGECTIPTFTGSPWNWPSGETIVQIAAGEYINIVRSSGGYIAAWGDYHYGVDPRSTLTPPTGVSGYLPPTRTYTDITAGGHFVMALDSTGNLISWGTWDYGSSQGLDPNNPNPTTLFVGPQYRGSTTENGRNPGNTGAALYDPPYKGLGAGHMAGYALTKYDSSNPSRTENIAHTWGSNGGNRRSGAQGNSYLVIRGTYQGGVGLQSSNLELDTFGTGSQTLTPHDSNYTTNYTFLPNANSSAYYAALTCYANCDGSTSSPVLNINDFICFQSRYANADMWADCNNDGSLTSSDLICFQSVYAGGCP